MPVTGFVKPAPSDPSRTCPPRSRSHRFRSLSRRPWREPAAIDALLRAVVASVDPIVAFTSLAAASVPGFVDECHVAIVDQAGATARIAYPVALSTHIASKAVGQDASTSAIARVEDGACGDQGSYRATVTFRWHDPTPLSESTTGGDDADVVIARLVTERVADQVTRERLAAAVLREAGRASNLETALATNREIGQAMGILMATHKLTTQQAFDLLRVVSQNSNRKLRDVADDVIHTGILEPPPQRATPARTRTLHVAAQA